MTKRKPACLDSWNPIPEDIRDIDLMVIAWRDCLFWAVGFKPIMDQFAESTGKRLSLPKSPVEEMVDLATGHKDAELRRFIDWFNVNVWGDCCDDVDDDGLICQETA